MRSLIIRLIILSALASHRYDRRRNSENANCEVDDEQTPAIRTERDP
jgi:hypothetical protein